MFLCYDFEVLKYDWLVVIYDMVLDRYYTIINDKEELADFHKKHINYIWVSFNGRSYDSNILKAILCGYNPYDMSDFLIRQKRKGWEFSPELKNIKLMDYDTYIENKGSLKRLESYMGLSIEESSIDFNIDRKLTENELKILAKYCKHDVDCTVEVFCRRKSEFDGVFGLIKEFNFPLEYISKTKAQLTSLVLEGERHEYNDEWDYILPDIFRLNKYKYVKDWFDSPENRYKDAELNTIIAGCPHTFAYGGVHGALPNVIISGECISVDVSSLYPSLMIEYDLLSRSSGNKAKFKKIRDERLVYKKQHNPLANVLKIAINSCFGLMGFEYSPLKDLRNMHLVCVMGQLALLDLIEHTEHCGTLLQSNTDGVYYKLNETKKSEFIEICHEWEKHFHLELEFDEFNKLIQRDVNSYIEVMNNGKIKSKGALVKQLNPLDYDLAVLNFAIKDYFVKGTPPEKTIQDDDSLIDFMLTLHVSSNYTRALKHCTFSKQKVLNPKTGRYVSKEMWNGDGETFYEKTFRVFASTNPNEGSLYKQKGYTDNPQKFANCPANIFIENGNIVGKKCSEYPQLDKMWYINEAWRRINQFYGKR